jgi:hypothetical protein
MLTFVSMSGAEAHNVLRSLIVGVLREAAAQNLGPKRVHARPGDPDGHEEYTILWELGGLSRLRL